MKGILHTLKCERCSAVLAHTHRGGGGAHGRNIVASRLFIDDITIGLGEHT